MPSWGDSLPDRGLLRFLFGSLSVVVGVVVIAQPGLALATLPLVLAVHFVVDGVLMLMLAFHVRPVRGWGCLLFSGFVSMLLGWMIISQWPHWGIWAVGILAGVRLLFAGMTMMAPGPRAPARGNDLRYRRSFGSAIRSQPARSWPSRPVRMAR